jgi:hypothetical protein
LGLGLALGCTGREFSRREFIIAVNVHLIETFAGGHSPFLEGQQIVAVTSSLRNPSEWDVIISVRVMRQSRLRS